MAGVVGLVGGTEQQVELRQAGNPGHGHQMAAPEATDLTLHAALLVGAVDPGLAEERVEPEVGA